MPLSFLIWPILEARAEICQKVRLLFGQWSFKENYFRDLLTFRVCKYSKSCCFVKKEKQLYYFVGCPQVQSSLLQFSLVVQKKVWPWSTFSIRVDIVTARKGQTPCHIFQEKDTYRGHTFQNSKKCRQGKVHPVFFCSQFSIFQTELKFLLPYW